ncbi:hypothetical protein C8J57DRAFT_1481561 [Mycena rebaudengoi]|nr:hypothetical protein C8J57DRAFT_1481561 [Mycena rebaudengoi]
MAETPTELRAQLTKIGEEEALLQSKLQLLAEKRRSILRKLDAVVYPVNTLPSDIMVEIFMHYVDTSFMEFSGFSMNLRLDSPLRLASVCSAWRRVALSFPRLWAALRLSWRRLSVPYSPLTLEPRSAGQLSQLCFPALEALEIWGDQQEFNVTAFIDEEDSDDAQTLVPIVMTKLHTLVIHPWSISSNCSIFDHLALPALRTLELGGDLNTEQLGALIRRSSSGKIGERFMEEEDADAEDNYCP